MVIALSENIHREMAFIVRQACRHYPVRSRRDSLRPPIAPEGLKREKRIGNITGPLSLDLPLTYNI